MALMVFPLLESFSSVALSELYATGVEQHTKAFACRQAIVCGHVCVQHSTAKQKQPLTHMAPAPYTWGTKPFYDVPASLAADAGILQKAVHASHSTT